MEQHNSSFPHAHGYTLVNGNAKKDARDIQLRAEREWNTAIHNREHEGLLHFCNQHDTPSYMIDRNAPDYEDTLNKAFHQASYLAKTRGKEHKPSHVWRALGTKVPKNLSHEQQDKDHGYSDHQETELP